MAILACSFRVSVGPGKSEGAGGGLSLGRVTRREPTIIFGNIKTLVLKARDGTECEAIVSLSCLPKVPIDKVCT